MPQEVLPMLDVFFASIDTGKLSSEDVLQQVADLYLVWKACKVVEENTEF